MLTVIYIIVIVYLLLFRNKQRYAWIIAASAIAILSITSTDYADLSNYSPLFDYYNSKVYTFSFSVNNWAWAILCKLFYTLGFNYRGMIICIVFINYFILHKAIQNIRGDENKFFALFLIFPSLIQLIQLKFFTAYVIVVYAYSILVLQKRNSTILFILSVFFASFIHSSAIVFLILLLIKNEKLNKNLIFVTSIILAIFIIFNMDFIINIAGRLISEQQYERYIVKSSTPSSYKWVLGICITWGICYIFALFVNKGSMQHKDKNNVLEKGVIAINILVLTLPLLLLDRNMHRFLEMGFAILYCMIASVFSEKKIKKNNITFIFLLCVSLAIIMYIYTPYKTVLKPLFSYDKIINIRR